MVTFNIRETGNELLRILDKELRWCGDCRLTIDLLIPEVLKGDMLGLCTSILQICQCLDSKELNALVNIELSNTPHSGDSIQIKIDVKAISIKPEAIKQFLAIHRKDIDALLAKLPYPTSFVANRTSLQFTFNMSFSDASITTTNRTEIARKNILLAEDDDITALVFISFLEEWEYNVTRVPDGLSAVDLAKLRIHDIILMDLSLPKMSGTEAISQIRQSDKETPIIALVSSPIDKDFMNKNSEVDDCIVKPVNGADLQRMLNRYL